MDKELSNNDSVIFQNEFQVAPSNLDPLSHVVAPISEPQQSSSLEDGDYLSAQLLNMLSHAYSITSSPKQQPTALVQQQQQQPTVFAQQPTVLAQQPTAFVKQQPTVLVQQQPTVLVQQQPTVLVQQSQALQFSKVHNISPPLHHSVHHQQSPPLLSSTVAQTPVSIGSKQQQTIRQKIAQLEKIVNQQHDYMAGLVQNIRNPFPVEPVTSDTERVLAKYNVLLNVTSCPISIRESKSLRLLGSNKRFNDFFSPTKSSNTKGRIRCSQVVQ